MENKDLLDSLEKNELLKEKITIVGIIDTSTKAGSAQLDLFFGNHCLIVILIFIWKI